MAFPPCLSRKRVFKALFIDRQGEKGFCQHLQTGAGYPARPKVPGLSDSMIAFSSTGREKRPSQTHAQSMNISCLYNSDDGLFLDRQGEKAIASVAESMNSSFLFESTMALSLTGRRKRPSQAHAKTLQSPRSIVFYDVLKPFSKKGN